MPSELAGPVFLAIILAAAACIAVSRRFKKARPSRIFPAAAAATICQALHVAEEYSTGFHLRVPPLFGLDPWSPAFFLGFNLAWLAIWSAAAMQTARGRLDILSATALWFLALASVGNGVWHPVLALVAGGYFPGLLSSLLTLPLGLFLIGRLLDSAAARSEVADENFQGPL